MSRRIFYTVGEEEGGVGVDEYGGFEDVQTLLLLVFACSGRHKLSRSADYARTAFRSGDLELVHSLDRITHLALDRRESCRKILGALYDEIGLPDHLLLIL